MNHEEFFEALKVLEKEKGIPEGYLLEKVRLAVLNAVKKDYGATENAMVEIDPKTGQFLVYIRKDVVDNVEDPETQITLQEAEKYSSRAKLDGFVDIPLETKDFGRIAVQAAKHIIRQGIREAEREQMLKEFQSKENEIVSVLVQKIDPVREGATVSFGKNEAVLPKAEQIPGEVLHEGERIKVYVVSVLPTDRSPKIMLSRTHPGFVKRLFELEVPEIFEGIVEVKSIAREAGSRTKMAVWSKDENIDAVGACIGPKQTRVQAVTDELADEKIDIIPYSESPESYISAALAPAAVSKVWILDEKQRVCTAIVPDTQLSLAIGHKGQNARLAARLTGFKIDIKPESAEFDPNTAPIPSSFEGEAEENEA